MRKNKQSTRSLIAFLVTWSFLVLTVTGIALGRKRLAEICRSIGIELEQGLAKLSASGIEAKGEMTARDLADRHQLSPIDLVKIMLQP